MTCYACGLATIDPEVGTDHFIMNSNIKFLFSPQSDSPGTYSINPGKDQKMYNHR